MSALARTTEFNCDTRAANEDCINGGSRTRTKYSYDANGNAISRNGSLVGWTSYNYLAGVSTSTESATFDYGPDRQRWRMIYTGPSGTETTYYISPIFEAVKTSTGTDYRHYIIANGKPVMVISRNTADATKFRSLLTDQQGSISTIVTDPTGTSDVAESFTAYGNRREASTWSGPPTSTELSTMEGVTREGYTFQTVLGSMGLNHMNGRVEDAVTGRFLSADPHVTQPGNTQGWNRYSYVNNNPLSFIDPTGFAQCPAKGLLKDGGASCGGGFADLALLGGAIFGGGSDDGFGNLAGFGQMDPGSAAAAQNSAITNALSKYNTSAASAAVDSGLQMSMAVSSAVDAALASGGSSGSSFMNFLASLTDPEMADANAAASMPQGMAIANALAPFVPLLLPSAAAEATTTSVFWSGAGTQAAAESWAAANGGTTLPILAGATPAEVTAASANFAASASGNVVVFQNAAQGVAVGSTWAQTEFGALMTNPSVTGITYNLIDDTGATICTIVCPK